jgi:hypothetical protein
MIPLPMMAYAAVGVLIALFGFYRYGHHVGWEDRDAEMQIEIAKKNAEAREIEHVMTGKINATATKLEEANHALDQKSSALDRAIRAGRVRLPTPSCVQAPADSTVASGDRDDSPTESERQTLAAIAAIVAEGDRAINQLNACITAYEEVRNQINGR